MEYQGSIDSDQILNLKFQVSGKISQVNFRVGQTITKGQLLARLDQTELQAYLDRSLRQYEQTRAEFDEKSQKNLDEFDRRKLQAELEIAVKNVEISKLNLEGTNLYSPINGVVLSADAGTIGLNITPGGFVINVLSLETLHFKTSVAETDLNSVHLDQLSQIKLKIFPDKVLSGKVGRISFVPDKSGRYLVIVTLTDAAGLRIGLSGSATFL